MATNIEAAAAPADADPPPQARIAVIGCGPKAVALAAMASVVDALNGPYFEIDIFDPRGVGANWGGRAGYTDGRQRLCTLAERDLGFPYNFELLATPGVAEKLAQAFSWNAFLVSGHVDGLSRWVNDGRRRPLHGQFQAYLAWALETAREMSGAADLIDEAVVSVSEVIEDGKRQWRVSTSAGRAGTYDAVVITGAGPPKRVAGPTHPNVFNGQDFWERRDDVRHALDALHSRAAHVRDEGIVIVGAGGTAAAILGYLVENGADDLPIELIAGSQAALHMRSENPFENRHFEDSGAWAELKPRTREDFVNRLNRGVVWDSVIERVTRARRLTIREGHAVRFEVEHDGTLMLVYTAFDPEAPPTDPPALQEIAAPAGLLIDATGFDDMWWTSLFGVLVPRKGYRQDLVSALGPSFELRGADWDTRPLVHAPMLSSMVGPGFASLMTLGGMAQRILSHHGA